MYDAILLASRDIEDRPGRKVLIIVTDGGDTVSRATFERAAEAAQLADAVIFPVLVVPISNNAGRNIGGENALTTLAQRTGGRVFAPTVGQGNGSGFRRNSAGSADAVSAWVLSEKRAADEGKISHAHGDGSGARGFVMADFGAQWILWRGVACGGCFARFIRIA